MCEPCTDLAGTDHNRSFPPSISPARLVSQIALLLDFASSRPVFTVMNGTKLPGEHSNPASVTCEYLRIAKKLNDGKEGLTPEDVCFLLQANHYLGIELAPITSESIAFSVLVAYANFESSSRSRWWHARRSANGPAPLTLKDGVHLDAEAAFPSYISYSQHSVALMRFLRRIAVVFTLLFVILSVYVLTVSMSLTSLSEFRAKTIGLEAEIRSNLETLAHAHSRDGALAALPDTYCPRDPTSDFNTKAIDARDPIRWHLCSQLNDLQAKRDDATRDLDLFVKVLFGGQREKPLELRTPADDIHYVTDPVAAAILSSINRYVLPTIMGGLGAVTFSLRSYGRKIRERRLVPRDVFSVPIMSVLGWIVGATIGFFYTPDASFAKGPAGLIGLASLSAPAVAFLAAYAAEAVLDYFDRLTIRMFSGRLLDARPRHPVPDGPLLHAH